MKKSFLRFLENIMVETSEEKVIERNSGVEISVVIPNYNGIKYLDECFGSLRGQSFKDFEVILVDDGSTDDSVVFVKKNYPWIKVVTHDVNRGFSASVNDGIKVAKGKFITLLNNDTMVDKKWLENLYSTAKRSPRAGFFASKMYFYGEDKLINAAGDAMGVNGQGWNIGYNEKDCEKYFFPRKVFGACAGAAMYRREMLDEIGLFDEDFTIIYEDADLSFRAQLMGFECVFVPDAVVYHLQFGTLGSLSEIKAFYSSANSLNLIIKNMPLKLFTEHFFKICKRQTTQIEELSNSNELLRTVIKGKLKSMELLPKMLKKRAKIQKEKKISNEYLKKLLLSEY